MVVRNLIARTPMTTAKIIQSMLMMYAGIVMLSCRRIATTIAMIPAAITIMIAHCPIGIIRPLLSRLLHLQYVLHVQQQRLVRLSLNWLQYELLLPCLQQLQFGRLSEH